MTDDEQTIGDIEHGLAEAQEELRQAEAILERKRAELVEAQAAEGEAIAAKAAFADEYNAIMNASRRPGEIINLSDTGWRVSNSAGAAAWARMQTLEQARLEAATWVSRLNAGSFGQIFTLEQWVNQCRGEVSRWEELRAHHEASVAAEQAKRASGWRPTLAELSARLRPR